MTSVFAYFRPRGVPGNYRVGILLDLSSTEKAEVHLTRGRSYGKTIGGKEYHTETAIGPNIIRQLIAIYIYDVNLAYPQRLVYQINKKNITMEQDRTRYYSPVVFHEIIIVDLDELTQAARQGKIHELEYMPEIAEVRQLLQRD